MFVYTQPVYPRRRAEAIFKQFYNIGLVLNFGAFVITITSFGSRLSSTFDDFFGNDRLVIAPSLQAMLTGCNPPSWDFRINHVTAASSMTEETNGFAFLVTTNIIIGVFVLHGILIICDALAKLCFSLNVRHCRIRAMHFPFSASLVLGVWCSSVATIALIAASTTTRGFLQTYVNTCSLRFQQTNPDAYVTAENDAETVFGLSFVLMLVATSINLAFYAVGAIFYLMDASRKEAATLVKEEFPWEKGILCKPDKPKLIAWSEWRREQERAAKERQPRARNPALDVIAAAEVRTQENRAATLREQYAANEYSRSYDRVPGFFSYSQPGGEAGTHRADRALPGLDDAYDDGVDGNAAGDAYLPEAVDEHGRSGHHGHRRRRRRTTRDAPPPEASFPVPVPDGSAA